MRTEQEIMDLILGVAKSDERIRAVYMNGSRTNTNAPKDTYQDYDIVFVVTETGPFISYQNWSLTFGTPLIVQEPDRMDIQSGLPRENYDFSRRYAWLMLFDDGNRIDLTIEIKENAEKNFLEDKLTLILLDKDGMFPEIPPPTDIDYHVKKPAADYFEACCNEFWWCLNNVAKGIARDEIPYAMHMLNVYVRDMLERMIEWHIGINTEFSVSAGKMGKYFKTFLSEELYRQYCKTYSGSEAADIWNAVFIMCDLFHALALPVAKSFGFTYKQCEEDGMREYLSTVKNGGYDSHCLQTRTKHPE